MEAEQKKTNDTSFIYKFLHFYRHRVMNLLIFFVIILYFITSMLYVVPKEIKRNYELLSQNVEQVKQYQEYANEANDLYINMQDQDYLSACQLLIGYIQAGGDIEEYLDLFNDSSDSFDAIFYLKSDGKLLPAKDREPLALDDGEIDRLLSDGRFEETDSEVRYYSLPCGNDHLIIRIDEAYAEQFSMNVLKFTSLDGFVFNDTTLEVVSADESDIPSSLEIMYESEPTDNVVFNDSDVSLVMVSPYTKGISKYTNMKLAAIAPLSYQLKGCSICVYIPLPEIISDIILKSGLPALLCMVFVFLCIFGSIHFRSTMKKNKNGSSKILKLPFNCYVDTALAGHIIFMQLSLGLLVILCSVVMLTLSRFTISFEDAKYNIGQLTETSSGCGDILEDCWEVYSSPAEQMTSAVNSLLMNGDIETDEHLHSTLNILVNATFIDEVSVYDRNGENVYTTAVDHVGYPLTQDPDSDQYRFWSLMSGNNTEPVLLKSDSGDGTVYCAASRSDEIGVIVLTFSDEGYSALADKLSYESVASNLNDCDAYLIMDQADPSTYHRLSKSGKVTTYANKTLPTLTNGESFCGFRRFGGKMYFVSGLGDDTHSIFYLDAVSDILSGLLQSILTLVLFLLIACVLDFIGSGIYTGDGSSVKEASAKKTPAKKDSHRIMKKFGKRVVLSEKMADSHKTIWRHCFYSMLCLIAIMLILDYCLNANSLLVFLLGSDWERGVNVFSLSLIVLAVLAVYVLIGIIKFICAELSKNLPPRSTTVIQMTYSIINIILVVWLILYGANLVGIDTKTILAGLGISGLALGIAAKDTVNDMINGVFIILDGRIQVGDYVEVGGFYGKITRIGIRTTKVNIHNKEKSVNNSDMKNLVNNSRGTASISINIKVPSSTDIDNLAKIIHDAAPRFRAACQGKLKGDARLLGVSELSGSGANCTIVIPVEECYRVDLTPKCNNVLKEVLAENNIELK